METEYHGFWMNFFLWILITGIFYLLIRASRQLYQWHQANLHLRHRHAYLLQSSSLLLLYHSRHGRITDCTEAVAKLLQCPRETLLTLHIGQLLDGDYAEAYQQYLNHVQAGRTFRGHVWVHPADGTSRLLSISSSCLGDSIQVLAEDVTRLWQSCRERKLLSRHHDQVLCHVPELILRVDRQGMLLSWNHDGPASFKLRKGVSIHALFTGSSLTDWLVNLSTAFRDSIVVTSSFEFGNRTFNSQVIPFPSRQEAVIILTDVTRQLRQEQELIHQYQRFHALSQTIPGILYRIDLTQTPHEQIIFLTDSIAALTGYLATDFALGRIRWSNLVLEEDQHLLRALHTVTPNNPSFSAEYRIRCAQHQVRWVLERGYTTYVGDKPVWRDGVILEITGLKQKELEVEALNQTLEEFRYAINAASIVSITDLTGKITYVNEKFCSVSGYREAELLGQRHSIVNSGLHPRSFWKSLWTTISRGHVWRGEVRNKTKDGRFYWVDTFIVPIKDISGKVIEYLSIRNEITEKKDQEAQLKLLSMVASQTSNFVLITDDEGRLEWVNASFENFTGYTLNEIQGKRPGSFLQGPDTDPEVKAYMSGKIRRQEAFTCELLNYTKRGEPFWVQVNAQPIYGLTGKVEKYFAILRNITAHKQLVHELEQAVAHAREADQLKSLFLANISHEIRTPMNAIVGFSELLERSNPSGSKQREYLRLIRERSYDLLQVVNDLLDISKIEAGHISLVEQWGNVGELLERLLTNVQAEVTHVHKKTLAVTLVNELVGEENLIRADFIRLNQVLVNLLNNAVKFTEQGSIELRCQWWGKDTLLFSVADTGIGIHTEKHYVIFQPFRQADEHVHQTFGGSGLGLAICRGFVQLWGGQIWVESSQDRGSIFRFTLPYKNF